MWGNALSTFKQLYTHGTPKAWSLILPVSPCGSWEGMSGGAEPDACQRVKKGFEGERGWKAAGPKDNSVVTLRGVMRPSLGLVAEPRYLKF